MFLVVIDQESSVPILNSLPQTLHFFVLLSLELLLLVELLLEEIPPFL